MTVFISGGCKNGKSGIAEEVSVKLAGQCPLYYIATMQPFDEEDRVRIKNHVKRRAGKGFITLEQPGHILQILDRVDGKDATFLLDSVTALMVNELYSAAEAMENEAGLVSSDPSAPERVAKELAELCGKVKNIVFVSDFIYMEKDNYSTYTLDYMKALSYVDRAMAKVCDAVCEVCFGIPELYKGDLPI